MKIVVFLWVLFATYLSAAEVYANFYVEASKSANLAIHAGGVVKAVYVDVAQSVKKGQKLVELANDESRASLEVAKTDVDNAQVALKYAQRDYERQEKVKHLLDEGRIDSFRSH
jgi:multidrug efflux pump subunit AcrA (membrane-fusion protein)